MAGPERFERPTPSFVAKCSIQLSYGPTQDILLCKRDSRVMVFPT